MAQATLTYPRIRRMAIYSVVAIVFVHFLIYWWHFAGYLLERDAWRHVKFAVDRRGGYPEQSMLLAVSSCVVTILSAIAARSNARLWTKANVLMCVPAVSYLTAAIGHARYEYFLALHSFHAIFLFGILAWPRLVRACPALLERAAATNSLRSIFPNGYSLCISAILILLLFAATNFSTVFEAVVDRTQTGGSAAGPVLEVKFNLWFVFIAQAFAVTGSFAVWSSALGPHRAMLRGILPLLAAALLAPGLVSAFKASKTLWPVMHSYDPSAFIDMTQGYVAWHVLSTLLSVICFTAIGSLPVPVLDFKSN